MIDRKAICALLEEQKIDYRLVEHPPAYTVEDIERFALPNAEANAKNLFLRDDKKKDYILLTARDDRTINLKEFQKRAGTRRLSFASEADLLSILGLTRGSVTPFGLLNDDARRVRLFMDEAFRGAFIWVHPCDNEASLYLEVEALMRLLQEHGNAVQYIDLSINEEDRGFAEETV